MVKWDPVDQTVLAEEQVDENGCSWRSGAKVENKILRQWFVRTTNLARDLYEGLDDSILQDWRDIIKIQRNWIGECNGVSFDFNLKSAAGRDDRFITLWTDKPEHIEDVKFIAVSKSHILSGSFTTDSTIRLPFVTVNPLTCEEVPVFSTDEVEFVEGTDSYPG